MRSLMANQILGVEERYVALIALVRPLRTLQMRLLVTSKSMSTGLRQVSKSNLLEITGTIKCLLARIIGAWKASYAWWLPPAGPPRSVSRRVCALDVLHDGAGLDGSRILI